MLDLPCPHRHGMDVDGCPVEGQFDHLERETPLHPGGAGEQHLHRLGEPGTGAGRASHHQRRGPARELAVEYQERQAPKWSPCRWVTTTASIVLGSIRWAFSATRLVAPQSTNSVCPAAVSRMHVCNRPPLPQVSPLPTNCTCTTASSPSHDGRCLAGRRTRGMSTNVAARTGQTCPRGNHSPGHAPWRPPQRSARPSSGQAPYAAEVCVCRVPSRGPLAGSRR